MFPDNPPVVILAGGAGQRMGGNKPFYLYKGRPLISSVSSTLRPQSKRLFINCASRDHQTASALAATGFPLVFDAPEFASLGPLSGVHTALKTAVTLDTTIVVTAPCDMPHLPSDMVSQLLAHADENADVVHFQGERDYPLCAFWRTRQLPHLEACLSEARASGGLGVMHYLHTVAVHKVTISNNQAFANINAPITGAREG